MIEATLTMNDQKGQAKTLIEAGSDLAGAAVGGALGFVAAGPVGAASAGLLGVFVTKGLRTLGDVAARHLSERERVRVGAAGAFALDGIRRRIDSGETPRGDDFLDGQRGKAPAEEILEGVLQKSKDEHEEKKIKYLGLFFASVAFVKDVSAADANHMLRMAERLSYRQMCLLCLILKKSQIHGLSLRQDDYRKAVVLPPTVVSTLQEIVDLQNFGLVVCQPPGQQTYSFMLGLGDVVPDQLRLNLLGARLAVLLGLGTDMPLEELTQIVADLSYAT